jgi:hypothetical protein
LPGCSTPASSAAGPVGGWRSATSPLNVANTFSVLPVPSCGTYGQVTAGLPGYSTPASSVDADVRLPLFVVSTAKDHVAPWRSVYKLHLLTDADLTFVLAAGGHNAGIVSEPGHPHRSYQLERWRPGDRYADPETWQATAARQEGPWSPAWQEWLREHSGGPVAPPPLGAAPGTYVLQE